MNAPVNPTLYSNKRCFHYFLILVENIDWGYSRELPQRDSYNKGHNLCFEHFRNNITIFHLKKKPFIAQ